MVGKLLGLAAGEGRKVLGFALLGAMLQAGLAVGMSTADSLFLVRLGADRLPEVYLATPLVMIVYIALYSFFLSRLGIDWTFRATLMLLGLGGVALSIGSEYALAQPVGDPVAIGILFAAKLYTGVWYIALYTLFWNFVDGYFDILDAKRFFSYLAAGAALGAAMGGGLVSGLSSSIEVHELFLVWGLLSLAAYPVFEYVRRSFVRLEVDDDDDDLSKAGLLKQAKVTFANFKASRFAVLIAVVLFLTMSVTLVCEYQYYAAFSKNRGEAELASLFGELFFAVNILNFFLTFVVFNRLVGWLGIRNLCLIQPVSYLITFAFFLLESGDVAATIGFFAYHGILTSIDYNSTNFLFNALPNRGKKQVRTFIEGLCEPMANALTGVFLLLLVKKLSPEQISTVGMAGAMLCLVLVLCMRSSYVSAMVMNLKSAWLDFSRSSREFSVTLNAPEIEVLKARIRSFRHGVDDVSEHLLAVRLIVPHDRIFALDALLPLIEAGEGASFEDANDTFTELLRERAPEIIQRVLLWLEEKQERLNPSVTGALARFGLVPARIGKEFLDSKDPHQAAAGSAAVHASDNLPDLSRSLATLKRLLSGTQDERLAAVTAIGCLRSERYSSLLLDYITHSSPELSYRALCSARELVDENSAPLLPALASVLSVRDERRRLVALDCIAKIGEASALETLLEKCWSFTPQERRKAEAVIVSIGLRTIPVIVSVLTDTTASYRARSIAARALAKLSPAQLEAFAMDLIDKEMSRAYGYLANQAILKENEASSAGCRVLSRFSKDSERVVTEFVLELLSLSGKIASFELLAASLRSSNQKERANAIETVHQACSRRVFRLFGPLLDSKRSEQKKRIIARTIRREKLDAENVLKNGLLSADPIESAASAQALCDIQGSAAIPLLQQALRARPASERAPVLRALIDREQGGHRNEQTLVERTDVLAACAFFEPFTAEEIYAVAKRAVSREFASNEAIYSEGSPATEVFVLQDGEVSLRAKSGESVFSSGELFGSDALFGEGVRCSDAISKKGRALQVSSQTIFDCAAANARIGAGLLAHKLGVVHGS